MKKLLKLLGILLGLYLVVALVVTIKSRNFYTAQGVTVTKNIFGSLWVALAHPSDLLKSIKNGFVLT